MEREVVEREPYAHVEEPDPITSRSMSGPLLIASLVLMGTLIWALYDEVYGRRPWKAMQREFVERYTAYLKRIKPRQAETEAALKQSPEYQKLER